MGFLSSRKARRVERKAEAKIRKAEEKALKTRVRLEAKVHSHEETKRHRKALREEHKFHKKAQKAERKTAKTTSKATQKAHAAEAKTVEAQAKAAEKAALFGPARVKRYLTVAKMLAPIAGPILYRGAIAAREQVTAVQARRAGVPAGLLTQYGGPNAALRARIAAAQNSADQVAERESTAEGKDFVTAMRGRLDNLVVATDAADTMPPAQRRAAQRAISNELTAIDNDLLARLNVHPA
ncbi:DUF6474 family protein [Gordonia sp. (in: high G+C Gram-positive bacteria)]|uniref:DUF6474 family protein n=1 Tax=unclassified Gordonia (in: high G+C Gram-positive bacteria) TaxID=2657482 RepID=UPI0026076159|nr:DUF6474 family protein [Gordonia sp. (in: high G+C Gram-positive bacteria)]